MYMGLSAEKEQKQIVPDSSRRKAEPQIRKQESLYHRYLCVNKEWAERKERGMIGNEVHQYEAGSW